MQGDQVQLTGPPSFFLCFSSLERLPCILFVQPRRSITDQLLQTAANSVASCDVGTARFRPERRTRACGLSFCRVITKGTHLWDKQSRPISRSLSPFLARYTV